MLERIHVKNFALIDEAELMPGPGLVVLTGETGAGKSILIDSVCAALGGRLKTDVVGSCGDTAGVSLTFALSDRETKILSDMDAPVDENTLILSRRISDNKSVHRACGEQVTASMVRTFAEPLIDIHGQHEHQSLLKTSRHLEIIDEFAGDESLREQVAEACHKMNAAKRELATYSGDSASRVREMDLLEYEIHEIESAHISAGEKEALMAEHKKIQSAGRIAAGVSGALKDLADGRDNAAELLAHAVRQLREAATIDDSLNDMLSQLEAVEDISAEVSRDLHSYANDLGSDPEREREVEDRLDLLNHLEQKYGNGYDTLSAALDNRKNRMKQLENFEELKSAAEKNLAVSEQEFAELAGRLSEVRKQAAKPFAEKIRTALTELNFLDVRFEVAFTDAEMTENGCDAAEFMISTNPGEPIRPLAVVASGGELSRIMLGIKTILADKDEIPTLIFDEIDTGISGKTALLVARKLYEISRYHQVICITHLPQIASMADGHFLIEKNVTDGSTKTQVEEIKGEARVIEIARLLSGENLSQASIANAREMLADSEGFKKLH
ncbi:MAG: DNA repair protein RecN [Lachnospiraceae bacterium]|nr:DNA repair protein RecN [Candidatus Minthocola equi]